MHTLLTQAHICVYFIYLYHGDTYPYVHLHIFLYVYIYICTCLFIYMSAPLQGPEAKLPKRMSSGLRSLSCSTAAHSCVDGLAADLCRHAGSGPRNKIMQKGCP